MISWFYLEEGELLELIMIQSFIFCYIFIEVKNLAIHQTISHPPSTIHQYKIVLKFFRKRIFDDEKDF